VAELDGHAEIDIGLVYRIAGPLQRSEVRRLTLEACRSPVATIQSAVGASRGGIGGAAGRTTRLSARHSGDDAAERMASGSPLRRLAAPDLRPRLCVPHASRQRPVERSRLRQNRA
jgi:hypothetical protein